VAAKNGKTATVEKKHNIRDVLVREIGEEIDKETDHRWDQPLTEERLRYASDDVKHLQPLYHALLEKVKKDGTLDAYNLIRKVYPLYMRQQVRGVPFDAELYEEMRSRLQKKVGILETQLREHAPITPKAELAASGSGGTIANRRSRKAVTAPSGPWPWQAHL
jgi:ribonuclease D